MNHVVKAWYAKTAGHLPGRLAASLDVFPFNPVRLLERLEVRQAIRSGPPYRPSHRKIIIDITTSCDLRCLDCDRSCGEGQAASDEHMSVGQIKNFIGESIEQGRRWKEIALEGGEPTRHPQLADILGLLQHYKKTFSPLTNIQLLTNGYGSRSHRWLDSLRHQGIFVINTRKRDKVQPHHCAFNIAPCDLPEFNGIDFSQGCYLPACYGLGLTKYGYYPHPICGGIDRVFGFDIGRKCLPALSDPMKDHMKKLCGFCGFFRFNYLSRMKRSGRPAEIDEGIRMSETWERAYSRYRKEKPVLKQY